MTLTGLSYLFSNFIFVWLLVAFIGGLIWGWVTSDRSVRSDTWFGPGFWPWLLILLAGTAVAVLKLIPGDAGLWFDNAVLFAATYFVGCWLGSVLSRIFASPARSTSSPNTGSETSARNLQAPATAGLQRISPYQWQAQKEGNSVTLTGFVPSEKVRTEIVDRARKTFGSGSVSDKLKLGDGAPAGLAGMAGDALGHLSMLDKGIASLIDSQYTLTGQALHAAGKASSESGAASLPSGFTLAKVDIVAPAGAASTATEVSTTDTAPAGEAALSDANRPAGLAAPRAGKADDLKRIRGIGKQNEGRLHGLGIWHFDQIAAWGKEQVEWVGAYLAFPGRIQREEWVSQAAILARGENTEFSRHVAAGKVATSLDDGSGGLTNVEPIAGGAKRPRGLSAPRPGKKDDLKLIKGIGRGIEVRLHAVGIYHFDQIAAMSAEELDWISTHAGFPGRAIRENWAGESKVLAAGGETDHSRAVKAGKIKTSLDDPGQ